MFFQRAIWGCLCLIPSVILPVLTPSGSEAHQGKGRTYFVDAIKGNDGNDGQSESNALKTIAKVNTLTFHSGDTVLLRRGQVWREQLILNTSQTDLLPITLGSYGAGPKPV